MYSEKQEHERKKKLKLKLSQQEGKITRRLISEVVEHYINKYPSL